MRVFSSLQSDMSSRVLFFSTLLETPGRRGRKGRREGKRKVDTRASAIRRTSIKPG